MNASRLIAPFLALACLAVPSKAQNVLFSDDFELGTSNWALTGNWRLLTPSDVCAGVVAPLPSGTQCLHYGNTDYCSFENFPFLGTATTLLPIALPATGESIELSFATNSDAEDWPAGEWDSRRALISIDGGTNWNMLSELHSSLWYRHVYDLTSYAGQSVLVRFRFDAVDGYGNQMRGWFVDDVAITARAEPGVPFCFGDWCPCTNSGSAGNGCATSFNPAGGKLNSGGMASVAADSVVLYASGLSNSVVTFFQGTGTVFDGLYGASAFGDGRRCVAGSVIRLKSVSTQGGAAQFPNPGDLSVSVRGAIPSTGGNRSYQVWYRNAADFCTTSTFNLTNGLLMTWQP